jgi:hypothetical protein
MTRIRNVGGKIVKTTGGNHKIYSEGNIVQNAGGSIIETGKDGVSFGTPEEYKAKDRIEIDCKLYIKEEGILKTPYLRSEEILDYKSSKLFIAGLRGIFGKNIKHTSIKRFMDDLLNGKVSLPNWKSINLSESTLGFFNKDTIYLNEQLILDSEKDPKKAWLLFRVMIEEIGHYVEDLLRNRYDKLGGDAPGDEGKIFAADFIKFNDLLNKSFDFAKFKVINNDSLVREFTTKVLKDNPNREEKAKDILFVEDNYDDHGYVTLKNGEKLYVEFFKIRGGGAIHEQITKNAAKAVGVTYDYRLDEGCAWPDVPCDTDKVETCYYKTWRNLEKKGTLAYESHNGSKQYWHSMAPIGQNTNLEVKQLIISQAKSWFVDSLNSVGEDALFHIGKILHMVQDSYSLSHVQRDAEKRILQFQGYDVQDAHKHGEADKEGSSKEAANALEASILILTIYKKNRDEWKDAIMAIKVLDDILNENIYVIADGREDVIAGGSLDAYKKKK